jgi:hypothetical protein
MFVAFPLEKKNSEAGGCNTALGAFNYRGEPSRESLVTLSATSRRRKSTHVFLTTQEKVSMNLHRLLTTATNSHKALSSRTAERKWRSQYEQSRSYR